MSHILPNDVGDSDKVFEEKNLVGSEKTTGPLVHGVNPKKTASPLELNSHGDLKVSDTETSLLLAQVVRELQILNYWLGDALGRSGDTPDD